MDDLISRRAAIEAIRELESSDDFSFNNALICAMNNIDEVSPAHRWIPVTEKLPETRAWVLCKCRAKIHEVLSWRDGEWYHDPQHRYMSGFVTHWMPLPGPPKVEE